MIGRGNDRPALTESSQVSFSSFFRGDSNLCCRGSEKRKRKKKFDVVCFANFVAQKPELAGKIEINSTSR